MPIRIQNNLPATEILEKENIFVMPEDRAFRQDIRPLRILILNLMPNKIATETQLLRGLSNSPLQVDIDLLYTATYQPKNTAGDHLTKFYETFSDVRDRFYDGMIITGAPVEQMDFEEVAYWPELAEIMEWSNSHVYSTLHICWGAQAALYYFYGVQKQMLDEKLFGIFRHKTLIPSHPLLRGFDEYFYAPHSRHSTVSEADLQNCPEIDILASSEKTGMYLAGSRDMKKIFVTGHSEYDFDTLKNEYVRDINKGLNISVPENYFPENNPENTPSNFWRSHAHLLFSNWLNYFVYQRTPFDLKDIQ